MKSYTIMGKICVNIIWMCEHNPVLCLFSSGYMELFTSPVYVWVPELSLAAHPPGNTAT